MRIRLDLAYDGTNFFGWAKQPNYRTVQQELELALAKVLPHCWGKPVPTIVGGRTDTGVHARGQVVHFDYQLGSLDLPNLLYRLSRVLPPDVVVHNAQVVPEKFSARFSATSRTYKYRICDNYQLRNPLRRFDVFDVHHKLDVRIMNSAAKKLLGQHDFATFVKPRPGQTSVRELAKFKFQRIRFGEDAGLVVATLKANAFAHNMVRSLVGATILVGSGQRAPEWLYVCLERKVREGATGPVAARGLTLERIQY
jgi:tRNA pseudouridine38-40 synthase